MPEQHPDTEAAQTPDASRQQKQAQRKADVGEEIEEIEDNERLDDDASPIASD